MSLKEFANICYIISDTRTRRLGYYRTIKTLDDQILKITSIFLSCKIFPKGSILDLNLGYNNLWTIVIII